MNTRNIGYWLATAPLALALFGSGAGKLVQAEPLVQSMEHLGFPLYMMTILGAWYVAAGVAILAPGLARLKEWAYAGVVFAFSGAIVSHVAVADGFGETAPSVALLAIAIASYALRPSSRRLMAEDAADAPHGKLQTA